VSAFAAPFGLKPLYHPSGIIRPKALDIASGYNTNIFQYTPVALGAPASGLIASTAVTGPAIGTFSGVEYTPTNQRRVYSNFWPANQVATQIVAYYTDDQLITYEIQANGSIAETQVGNQANVTAEVGNTVTGFSTIALDTTTLTTNGNALLKIVGLTPGPLNAFGDAFTIVQVQIANHQFTATRAAF
jgi:hypothetical protein